jgi:hypothetical protein
MDNEPVRAVVDALIERVVEDRLALDRERDMMQRKIADAEFFNTHERPNMAAVIDAQRERIGELQVEVKRCASQYVVAVEQSRREIDELTHKLDACQKEAASRREGYFVAMERVEARASGAEAAIAAFRSPEDVRKEIAEKVRRVAGNEFPNPLDAAERELVLSIAARIEADDLPDYEIADERAS